MNPGDALVIGKLKALAARRQQVPAQSAIADTTLEDHHRRIGDMPHVMPDTDLRADVAALDGHPLVVEDPHAAGAASHDAHVANVLALRPIAIVVDEVGVQLLLLHRVRQRALGLPFAGLILPKPSMLDWPSRMYTCTGLLMSAGLPSGSGSCIESSPKAEHGTSRVSATRVRMEAAASPLFIMRLPCWTESEWDHLELSKVVGLVHHKSSKTRCDRVATKIVTQTRRLGVQVIGASVDLPYWRRLFITLPLAGGSDAVAAGEGHLANRIAPLRAEARLSPGKMMDERERRLNAPTAQFEQSDN